MTNDPLADMPPTPENAHTVSRTVDLAQPPRWQPHENEPEVMLPLTVAETLFAIVSDLRVTLAAAPCVHAVEGEPCMYCDAAQALGYMIAISRAADDANVSQQVMARCFDARQRGVDPSTTDMVQLALGKMNDTRRPRGSIFRAPPAERPSKTAPPGGDCE